MFAGNHTVFMLLRFRVDSGQDCLLFRPSDYDYSIDGFHQAEYKNDLSSHSGYPRKIKISNQGNRKLPQY